MIIETFRQAIQNVWSNKLRTFLTMLGIIIGVMAVIVIVGLGNGMTKSMRDSFSALGTNTLSAVSYTHLDVYKRQYKKWAIENGKKYFSVASGGGTGRTLHPDNVAAGPASYGLTDSLGRVHGDAQFAGSSSVPAHVEMMGLIGMGNNPMVGATVACAVAAAQANA